VLKFLEIIRQEITWFVKNSQQYSAQSDYERGFIAGLKQAEFLATKTEELGNVNA
jgi:hypothetical protein